MLKQFAATYISLQENLSDDEKISIIKWVREAGNDEIKSLLITGDYEVSKEASSVFDNTIGVILEQWGADPKEMGIKGFGDYLSGKITGVVDMNKLMAFIDAKAKTAEEAGRKAGIKAGEEEGIETGVVYGLAAAAVAALVIVVANKVYKRFLSAAARACNKFKGDQRTSCMANYRRQALKKKLADLQQGVSACKHTKKPEKCKQRIAAKINSTKAKLGTL